MRRIGARGTVDGPCELEVLRLNGGIESVPGVPWHEVESPAVGAPRLSEARGAIALTVVLGAGLFWWVQPLGAEQLVARHGGGAEVWTACLCFFQLALLAGYTYAHGLSRWIAPRHALCVHGAIALVAAALFQRPLLDPHLFADAPLTWRVMAQLASELGPAALALAATSPLLQLAHHHVTGRPPWRLHALANLVALALLVAHPFALEPHLPGPVQATVWQLLLVLYGVACFGVTMTVDNAEPEQVVVETHPAPPWLWGSLAACASALLLATTEAMSRDVASVPLLWVAPLAVFLLSVIVTFDRPALYRRGPVLALMLLGVAGVSAVGLFAEGVSFEVSAGAHLLVLAAGCTLCHGELYRGRPDPDQLTGYHLSMALGGALGGLGVAVGAPALLDRMVELPLVMGLTLVAFALAARRDPAGRRVAAYGIVGLLLVGAGGGALGLSALESAPNHDQTVLERSRNVHGALTLVERRGDGPTKRLLVDGNTTHGFQYLEGPDTDDPTLYYARETGVGEAFLRTQVRADSVTVALIGLGVGTLAAYGRPADRFVFYEVNPEVVRLARERFTFLSASEATVAVEVGDGRALLARTPTSEQVDLLVVDAFSSDAIPTHLLTREALALYLSRLRPDGLVAFHVTNRTLDLVGVVEALASDAEVGARVVRTEDVATWVLVGTGLKPSSGQSGTVWTDDHAPVWQALRP